MIVLVLLLHNKKHLFLALIFCNLLFLFCVKLFSPSEIIFTNDEHVFLRILVTNSRVLCSDIYAIPMHYMCVHRTHTPMLYPCTMCAPYTHIYAIPIHYMCVPYYQSRLNIVSKLPCAYEHTHLFGMRCHCYILVGKFDLEF